MRENITKEDVVKALKEKNVRIIEINHSDKKYKYVEDSLKHISEAPKFHYNGKNTIANDSRYYGFRVGKNGYPVYLFVDEYRKRIMAYDLTNKNELCLDEYEELKEIITKQKKNPIRYLKRNLRTDNMHHKQNVVLLVAIVALILCYAINYLNDARFSAISLYIADIIALQDCINVFQKKFEYKSFDTLRILSIILEFASLLAILCAFILPLDFTPVSTINNFLCAFVTLGTLILKLSQRKAE